MRVESILYDMLVDLWCLPFIISSSLQKSGADDTTDGADAFWLHPLYDTDRLESDLVQ